VINAAIRIPRKGLGRMALRLERLLNLPLAVWH